LQQFPDTRHVAGLGFCNSVASTSRRSAGVTALNSAERSRATRLAKGLPLACWLPGANFPLATLPLAPVGDGELLMPQLFAGEADLTLTVPDSVPPARRMPQFPAVLRGSSGPTRTTSIL
jgi:hypothetical protein